MIVQTKKGKEALQNPMKEYARLPFLFLFRFPHVAGIFGSGAELLTLIPFLE